MSKIVLYQVLMEIVIYLKKFMQHERDNHRPSVLLIKIEPKSNIITKKRKKSLTLEKPLVEKLLIIFKIVTLKGLIIWSLKILLIGAVPTNSLVNMIFRLGIIIFMN